MKLIKKLTALLAVLALSATAYAAEPASPDTTAKSAILINADTGRILYEKNDHEKMYPASMTKMLTAMVVLDNMDINDTITVDSSINEVPWDSSKAGI
ncbi:MAG: D-alanyl-D-alanine carboxypeptidase, partial [Clostridia bacterium]|nr:D-alanyl-D-alanine carboxypeptidase [Clostridia bacterium]